MARESAFSPEVQSVINEIIPICRQLAAGRGRYAIAVGGSQGKGTGDRGSDIDFRLFHEHDLPWPSQDPDLWKDYFAAEERWKRRGIIIDGIWPRRIDQIEAALNRWMNGDIRPDDLVWTIWGYHLLPDLYYQAIIEDPYGVISGWKERLRSYPPPLRQAVLDKHLKSVQYWRNDYHYRHKVERGDIVFAAGLAMKLVHNLIQVLFAINDTYYVGDGQNLESVLQLRIVPADFAEKVKEILYPTAADPLIAQYRALMNLIDEIMQLVPEANQAQ